MIRIRLAPEDIARTRIAPAPLPLHEVFVSLSGHQAARDPELAHWLRQLRQRLPGSSGWQAFGLGAARHFPDFLAPLPGDRSLEGALERLLTTPVERTGPHPGGGTSRRAVADAGSLAQRTLVAAVRAYHDRCVAGELAAGESLVRLDVGERSRTLATGGVEALLATLDPWAGWHNPVLTVPATVDLDLRPGGTGLLLVPSLFARELWVGTHPGSIFVAYPVRRSRAAGHRPVPSYVHPVGAALGDPLTALLGRSRAAVLRAARVGANTTDLARRAGISTPSASQHASVLRDAGLLRTTRHGKAAHHTLTPLARALLIGDDVPSRR